MTVEFGCPECGRAVETAPGSTVACRQCGQEITVPASAPELESCLVCSCQELYRHRDFNQKLGLLIIAAGALLWLFMGTFWPMVAAAALDLLLYFTIPDVAICYDCKAHHRDFENIKRIPTFDLERYEHYRFKQARAEGRVQPRAKDD